MSKKPPVKKEYLFSDINTMARLYANNDKSKLYYAEIKKNNEDDDLRDFLNDILQSPSYSINPDATFNNKNPERK